MRITLRADVDIEHPKAEAHVQRAFQEFLSGLPAHIAGVTVIEDSADGEQVPQRGDEEGAGTDAGSGDGSDGSDGELQREARLPKRRAPR